MKIPAVVASLAVALATASSAMAAIDAKAERERIDVVLDRNYPQLDRIYKDLHSHPEVGFQEVRSARLLTAEMRKLGFEVTEQVGKTGLVAIYRNGPGPTVLVRTDLDGLPLEEKTGLPYASRYQQTVDGKLQFTAHACGHDAHMAWWLGTAQALVAMKDRWQGTLMFVGQPAEEVLSGARAMMADGLFTRFPKPDYGFAAHVTPRAIGSVEVKDGITTSAQDALEIVFKGRGAHGSMPSASIDPIVIGAHFVSDVQTIISRERDANAFGVVTVGSFQAGSVANIIPDHADLKLTLRSFTPEVRKLLVDGVTRTALASSAMAGAPVPEIRHLYGAGSVRNDSALSARLADVLKAGLGNGVVLEPNHVPGSAASEDFSEFVDAGIPSVYIKVGGGDPAKIADLTARGLPIPINHSPLYAPVPEPTIRKGVEVLTLAVLMVTQRNDGAPR